MASMSTGTAYVDTVGVGPWPGDWPDDPRYDPDLLRDGDRRNVADHYRYWHAVSYTHLTLPTNREV